jgi:hypothetical protein
VFREQTPEPFVFLFQPAALTAEDIDFGAVNVFALHQSIIRQKTIALLTTRITRSGVNACLLAQSFLLLNHWRLEAEPS